MTIATSVSTSNISPSLDIPNKLVSIIDTILSDSSIYARTVEILSNLENDGNITSAERADITTKLLGELNIGVVSASLQAATQWAFKEKEVEIKLVELGRELAMHDQDIYLKAASVDKMKADADASEAMYRATYGAITRASNGAITYSIDANSKVAKEIEYSKQQALNTAENTKVLTEKITETRAGIYKTIADTRANFGDVSAYSLTNNAMTVTLANAEDTLHYWQKEIAQEQMKGYGWNAWSNAVTSAAGMVSTLIASEAPDIFDEGKAGTLALDQVNTGITQLLAVGTSASEPSVTYRSASTGKVITYNVLTLLSVEAAVGETFTLPGTVTTGAAARQITFTGSGSWTIAVAGSYSKIHLSGCAVGNMSGKICWSTSTVTETASS
jgi:hypothetical protein